MTWQVGIDGYMHQEAKGPQTCGEERGRGSKMARRTKRNETICAFFREMGFPPALGIFNRVIKIMMAHNIVQPRHLHLLRTRTSLQSTIRRNQAHQATLLFRA
mmetsp:Transcript_12017/g.33082  ORF Transcript_12017/g.33082 Transcript_12017/m.33082 type:complete len:103 (+) Transcript_12017:1896-2204(+)